MESEISPFAFLDPLIDRFVRNVFSLKVCGRINPQSPCDYIGTLFPFKLSYDVLTKVIVQIELPFPFSSTFPCSICALLGKNG